MRAHIAYQRRKAREAGIKALANQKQIGIIKHGGGLNLEYAILDARTTGHRTVSHKGYTEIFK